MNEPASIRQAWVAAHKSISGNSRSVYLDSERIDDDILSGLVKFGVNKRHKIITSYHISECAEPFFDSIDLHTLWQYVSQCLQLTIGGAHRNNEPVFVASAKSSHDFGTCNRTMGDWDMRA